MFNTLPLWNTSRPVLPQELVDIVIDYLHYDRLALAACSLVCRAWVPSSRYHLFSDVRIDYLTIDKVLRSPQISSVAPYVRRLMVCHLYPLPTGIEVFSLTTSLYVYGCIPYAQMCIVLPSAFTMMTYLELFDVKFQSFAEMVELFCSFPKLRALSLSSTWDGNTKPHSRFRPPPGLCVLNIRGGLRAVLPWFANTASHCQLSTLRIFRLAKKHIEILGDALRAFGSSLRHLEVGLRSHRESVAFMYRIYMGYNTFLEYFVLHNATPALFQSILPSALQNSKLKEAHLVTAVWEKASTSTNRSGWFLLDDAITNTTNHHLSKLIFRLDVVRADFRELIVEEIKKHLPISTKRGIVQFISEKQRLVNLRMRMTGPVSFRCWGDTLTW